MIMVSGTYKNSKDEKAKVRFLKGLRVYEVDGTYGIEYFPNAHSTLDWLTVKGFLKIST